MVWIEKLKPEQKPAVEFVCSRPGSLLLGDTGVGKTYITLACIEKLAPSLTLLVVPLTSIDVVWSPKLSTMTGFQVIRRVEDLPRRQPSASVSSSAPSKVILLLHMQAFSKLSKRLGKRDWDFVVIDESQVLKARGSGFSRAARRLRNARRRLALSATPLDKTPIDLFGQMRFVNHNILGEDFTPFCDEYCRAGGWKGHKKIFRKSKMKKFMRVLSPCLYRLSKEFLGLPPVTIIAVPVQLLGKQAELYRRINRHSVSHTPAITARLAVTKQGKLEQITGGIVLDNTDTPVLIGHAKERKLRSLVAKVQLPMIREKPTPLVVFCKYLHEIPLIKGILRTRFKRVAELHGAVKNERTQLIIDFADGLIDALVCQVRTGGVSIELQRSCTLIFYSFGFSMIDFEQIKGRFDRGGQLNPVSIFILHAVNTVDDEIIEAIEGKYEIFREFKSSIDTRHSIDVTRQ